jgi:toxin secretion/phage lysis holin
MNWETIVKVGAATATGLWCGLEPMIQLLVALMALDIITGIIAAFNCKELDSGIASKGMVKKALVLCLVGVGLLLETYSATAIPGFTGPNIPISEAIAGFFAASEGLSIIENSAKAGVPIPSFLRDALARLSPEKQPTP